MTLGKSLSLSGSHLASVDNKEENVALPTSWGCIFSNYCKAVLKPFVTFYFKAIFKVLYIGFDKKQYVHFFVRDFKYEIYQVFIFGGILCLAKILNK